MSKKNKLSLEDFVSKAMINIDNDRSKASILLADVLKIVTEQPARYADLGTIASKYIENLQRSNEQLVKLSAILKKENSEEGMTDEERENIFNLFQEEQKTNNNSKVEAKEQEKN